MKNKVLLIIGSLILVIFLIIGTYSWYLYFLQIGRGYYITSAEGTRIGDIILIDNGKNVYDADAKNLDDKDVLNVQPYSFKISNLGNTKRTYTLYIEDLPLNSINDGCSSKTLLNRSQLKYQLKVNGKDANSYELRIYIHDTNEDWYNKHYHYRVVLKKVI